MEADVGLDDVRDWIAQFPAAAGLITAGALIGFVWAVVESVVESRSDDVFQTGANGWTYAGYGGAGGLITWFVLVGALTI